MDLAVTVTDRCPLTSALCFDSSGVSRPRAGRTASAMAARRSASVARHHSVASNSSADISICQDYQGKYRLIKSLTGERSYAPTGSRHIGHMCGPSGRSMVLPENT